MTVNVTKPAINLREKLSELDKPSGIAGQDILKADTPQEVFNYIGAGRRNLIINGAMQVAQRGTSFNLGSTNAYTLDRWSSNTGSSFDFDVDVTQSTEAPAGFNRSLKISPATVQTPIGSHNAAFTTRLEGQDIQCFGFGTSTAKDMMLSFWVRSNKTGTYSVQPFIHNATAITGIFDYTINNANTWEYKTINIGSYSAPIEVKDSSKGMEIFFHLACGIDDQVTPTNALGTPFAGLRAATGQVNIMDSTSNEWYITGVQLEIGSVATPFEHRSYGEELALCQRYYYKHGQGTGANTSEIGVGFYYNSTTAEVMVHFPVEMRATPSYVGTSGTNYFVIFRNNAADYVNSFSMPRGSTRCAGLENSTEASGTAGHGALGRFNSASAIVAFDAEL
jgi:hypothetical protein